MHIIILQRSGQKKKRRSQLRTVVRVYGKDGTYEGSGQGFGGQIVVSVTIKNGSIDDIQIKEAKNEDSAYFNNAKKIIDTMKQKQTADVDVASGATYSSKGIIAAVRNALKEAS